MEAKATYERHCPDSIRVGAAKSSECPSNVSSRTTTRTRSASLLWASRQQREERLCQDRPLTHAQFHVSRGQELLAQGFVAEAQKEFREATLARLSQRGGSRRTRSRP